MLKKEYTQIRITKDTREELNEQKLFSRETFDEVINRLFNAIDKLSSEAYYERKEKEKLLINIKQKEEGEE